jgi:hypothetical protein
MKQTLIETIDNLIVKELKQYILEDWKTNIQNATFKLIKDHNGQHIFNVICNNDVIAKYTPERRFVEINTNDALEFFKETFKTLGISVREDKHGGEGKITSFVLKDAGNMKLLKSLMTMTKNN